jgi:hypothetical protein
MVQGAIMNNDSTSNDKAENARVVLGKNPRICSTQLAIGYGKAHQKRPQQSIRVRQVVRINAIGNQLFEWDEC